MDPFAVIIVIVILIVLFAFVIPILVSDAFSNVNYDYKWTGWNHPNYSQYYYLNKFYWYPDYFFYRGYYPMYYPRYTRTWLPWRKRFRYQW